jgi:hypothetical protein
MGFKSRALPAIEVLRVDGVACQGFAAKQTPAAPPVMNRIGPSPVSSPEVARDHLFSKYC